ncbi:hypothetical protein PIB30_068547 [Stylosanthes scabra]|uniref:Zinc finger GRF-type domain-containing protein n=1 Tax=Stylosanthes scabra TaxID=79078 RepID=A0ABU6YLR4_9FABA|nr:hypothetical protein [Stylosanthes scabra]
MTQSMDDNCSDGFTDQGHETKPFDSTCYYHLGVVALRSKTKNNPKRWFYICPKWKVRKICIDCAIKGQPYLLGLFNWQTEDDVGPVG